MEPVIAQSLAGRRHGAGLTQRELARASGIAQPNIAAYESGTRVPSASTLRRLSDALSAPTLEGIRAQREVILGLARRRGLSDVRVFGSVARGESTTRSDVDLLVHPSESASIFDLAGFMAEARSALGVPVDVVSDGSRGPVVDRIRAEAVPL